MPQQAGSAAVKARGKALVDATADTTGERPTIAQIDPIPELGGCPILATTDAIVIIATSPTASNPKTRLSIDIDTIVQVRCSDSLLRHQVSIVPPTFRRTLATGIVPASGRGGNIVASAMTTARRGVHHVKSVTRDSEPPSVDSRPCTDHRGVHRKPGTRGKRRHGPAAFQRAARAVSRADRALSRLAAGAGADGLDLSVRGGPGGALGAREFQRHREGAGRRHAEPAMGSQRQGAYLGAADLADDE